MTDFKELREALDAVEHSAMAFERCPDAHTGRRLNDARKKLLGRLEAAERDAERLALLLSHAEQAEDGWRIDVWIIGAPSIEEITDALDAMKEQQP